MTTTIQRITRPVVEITWKAHCDLDHDGISGWDSQEFPTEAAATAAADTHNQQEHPV